MEVRPFLVAALLALAGCEAVNEGDSPGPEFALGSTCRAPGADPEPLPAEAAVPAKRAGMADTSGLRVFFVSADSLHFAVPLTLNCGLQYAFSVSLPSPDTLEIAQRVTGGATARCVCRKDLTVRTKAEAGQSLDKVKVLKTPSGVFPDFH